MGRFVTGLIFGLILLAIGIYLYFRSGYAPVATAAAPFPMEKTLAKMALNARIAREAPAQSPIEPSEANLLEGARTYREYCAVCHGTKGQPKTPTAAGMYPPPPQLMQGKGVTDDPVGETYWKVANGIRLTGMPAYGESLGTPRIWQVTEFLAHSNSLPAAVETVASEPPAK